MLKKFDMVDGLVLLCSLCLIGLCLYYISDPDYLGLSVKDWKVVWGVSRNLLTLLMCFIIIIHTASVLKWFFVGLIPFCLLQIVYYFSCYSENYLFSDKVWTIIWGWTLAFSIMTGLGYTLFKLLKNG